MRRLIGVLAGAVIAFSAPVGSNALATTEFGDDCGANAAEPGYTLLQLARGSGSTLPLTAPSAGVITSWTVRLAPGFVVAAAPVRLEVFRATTSPSAFQVVGESADTVAGNPGFKQGTRVSVLPGDRLGIYGVGGTGTPVCSTGPVADELGLLAGDAPLGSTHEFAPRAKFKVPVSATLEPDLDGDGYGDETQDGCPKSPTHHGACPSVRLEITEFWAKRHSIVLHLTASSKTKVHVYGQVGWGFRPKQDPNRGKPTRLIVGLRGGTKTVKPGRETEFRVQLPKPVLRRLGRISPQESLKAKITASTEDLAGRVEVERVTVRLKGRDGG